MRRPRVIVKYVGYASAAVCLLTPLSLFAQANAAASPDFFETKIRPILANRCFECHTDSALGGLRLDSAAALMKGGDRGVAVVPGDPDNSLLIKAVRQTEPALKMPLGGKLEDSEITALSEWVKAGAVWPKTSTTAAPTGSTTYAISPERRNFWSFKALENPPAPAISDTKWAKTEIDKFVLAKLEKEKLKPVAPASKRDLLRRATLDLTGLQPTAEEIAAFEKDNSPDAFAKVVDRLLASPHYGERWGRVWLDVARYGEDDYRSLNPNPKGYRPYPNAYLYRDWVIQAFNDDLPYDKFVKAQLAGDLMGPQERVKMLPATGFLGLGPWYYDNGSNEVTRADERHDRVDAVTRGFLGLTVACARCHNHKYDPIPQTDYYALAGVFFNTVYEEYPQAPQKVVADYDKLSDSVDEKQKILGQISNDLSMELSRSLVYQTSNYLQGVWEVTGPQKKEIDQVVDARKLDYELLNRWITYMGKTTDKYKNKDAWQAMMKKGGTAPQAKKLADRFQDEIIEAMLAKNDLDAQNKVIADKDIVGTKPKKRTDKPSNFVSNKDFNPGSDLVLQELPTEQNNFWIEIFQREITYAVDPNMGMEGRQGKPGVLLFRGWGLQSRLGPESQERLKTMQDDLEAARKKLNPHYPFLHGVMDSAKPVNIKLAIRGNPENLGDEVPRHFLSVLSNGDPTPLMDGSGRLQMADLIVKQPLAMRVIVNRIWKEHFGTGIVDTPSNFGFAGERPTNPELLEYLANEFVRNGMSIKKLQREIMLSSVYQLSTADNTENFAKDSGDRLYWRATLRRMDAEQVRDSVLQAAGELDDSVGGESKDLTPSFKRRTVYGKVSRYKLDAYLQLFDFPPPNISAEKRFTTTVPLQRLFLMNSDFVQIEAEALAKRAMPEANNQARIRKLYSLVYGRSPNADEIDSGMSYLGSEPGKEYAEAKAAADKPKKGGNAAKEGGPGKDGAKDVAAKEGPGKEGAGKDAAAGKDVAVKEGAGDKAAVGDKAGAGDKDVSSDKDAASAKDDQAGEAAGEGVAGAASEVADANAGMGMGMMGGMAGAMPGGRGRKPDAVPETKYDTTVWGRYAKVLLSSSEFLFID